MDSSSKTHGSVDKIGFSFQIAVVLTRPDIMLQSLFELLAQKTRRYGAIGTGFDSLYLIVYYSSAAIYNTPVETANFEFKDAAEMARQFIDDDHDPFNHIFLFVNDLVLTVV